MNLLPKYRNAIMKYFKKKLGYGYYCRECKRNARILQAYINPFSSDMVMFRCPGCRKTWGMEFKNDEMKGIVIGKN